MQKVAKIFIIGIGFSSLNKRISKIVNEADIIVTTQRVLDVFKSYEEYEPLKDKIFATNNISDIVSFLRDNLTDPDIRKIVFLGSGDPLFHGIASRLITEFGKDLIEIVPDISSVQLAFARIKEPWDDALILSLHGISEPTGQCSNISLSELPSFLMRYNKIALLTDKQNDPASIAKKILDSLPEEYSSSYQVFVCEDLGLPNERITQGTPMQIAEMKFSDLNIVILMRQSEIERTPIFGLSETEFQHSRGLITKDEVRAVSIHKLKLPEMGIFWDIGAGSGSVAIEVAKLSPRLSVYAIEKDDEEIVNLEHNKRKFLVHNLTVVKGTAPDCLDRLPTPKRVFIGGSGGRLKEIIATLRQRMPSGIVVINATTIDTLNQSIDNLEEANFSVEVVQVSVSRVKSLSGKMHFSALNPVFVITGMINE